MISDSFCSSTAAITQPCGAAPRESGIDTLANRPCSLATNEPHSRRLNWRRCSSAASTCGDFSASAGSFSIFPSRGARDTPADHVRRADQHGGRLAGARERAGRGPPTSHYRRRSGTRPARRAGRRRSRRFPPAPSPSAANPPSHRQAGSIARRAGRACCGHWRRPSAPARPPTDRRTSVPKLSAMMAATGMRRRFSAGRTKRTGSVGESISSNVVTSRRIASPGRMQHQVASAARSARPARQPRDEEGGNEKVPLSRSTMVGAGALSRKKLR